MKNLQKRNLVEKIFWVLGNGGEKMRNFMKKEKKIGLFLRSARSAE